MLFNDRCFLNRDMSLLRRWIILWGVGAMNIWLLRSQTTVATYALITLSLMITITPSLTVGLLPRSSISRIDYATPH